MVQALEASGILIQSPIDTQNALILENLAKTGKVKKAIFYISQKRENAL